MAKNFRHVVDTSGRVIPNCSIALRIRRQVSAATFNTNTDAFYTAPNCCLEATISASPLGFRTDLKKGVELTVERPRFGFDDADWDDDRDRTGSAEAPDVQLALPISVRSQRDHSP